MLQTRRLTCGIILMVLTSTALGDAHAGYRAELRKWTKSGQVYAFETLDALLMWDATLVSGELVSAQERLAAKKRVDIRLPHYEGVNFFLSVYTRKRLEDFSLDKNSTWKIYLVGADGEEISPLKIERITMTPTEAAIYPHVNNWAKPYRVEFPQVDLGARPKLILRSIVASSTLEWNLKKGGGR